MNEEIAKLLEYQQADLEYRRLEKTLTDSNEYRTMRTSKKTFDAAKQRMAETDSVAGAAVAVYEGADGYLSSCAARIDELCEILRREDLDEETERAALGELEALRATIGEWEKKLSQARSSSEKARDGYIEAHKAGRAAKETYNTAKAKYDKALGSNKQKLDDLKATRDGLAASVDGELMAAYKSISSEGKNPAFVPAMGDEKSPICRGCGMGLAEQSKNELKNYGRCRCENCGRMIYSDWKHPEPEPKPEK